MTAAAAATHLATLTLDTAQSGLAIGLFMEQKQPVIRVFTQARGSELLHPTLLEMLESMGITPQQLGRVIVTVGPGSFTGIRIGLAVADALRHTIPGLQVVGLPSLSVLAQAYAGQSPVSVVLPAAGPDVYVQHFNARGESESEAACLPLTSLSLDLSRHYIVGTGVLLDVPHQTFVQHAHPETMFAMAHNPVNHVPALPVYLKPLTYKVSAA